ncbi:hypothetical protein RJ641_029760, partial [Dillenia turbinata]
NFSIPIWHPKPLLAIEKTMFAQAWARESSRIAVPPAAKFRSGHLPAGVVPTSRVINNENNESGPDSYDERSTESETDTRYSLDSSPWTAGVPYLGTRRHNSVPSVRKTSYATDYVSSDVSSSRDNVGLRNGKSLGRNGVNGFTEEDESSDSASSSGFSSIHGGGRNGSVPRLRVYDPEGYASRVASRIDVQSGAKKVLIWNAFLDLGCIVVVNILDEETRNLQNWMFVNDKDEEIPSAPPFTGSLQEISQDAEQIPTVGAQGSPSVSYKNKLNTGLSPGVNAQKNMGQRTLHDHYQNERTSSSTEAAVPTGSFLVRLPTFHASAQGPWLAVITYDACVRLCLNAWARGCGEAPMFLKNECALLRDSFRLQNVLLQSEEELLENRSSELTSEGSLPKPKKIGGKIKVQVRQVTKALDPPRGCSFPSLPVMELGSVSHHLSNLQFKLSSGWQAFRKVRFTPHVPANASFSRQSFAYVQASTQYIKQVSNLLRTGVTSLRNSSSSYEAVQETYSCLLRLKSLTEEDAIRLQPGSSETHVFFPDGLGDDLIVEIHDSNGKHYGRVIAQVAAIAEDPNGKLRWWSIYSEPEHELVGQVQLYINYSTFAEDNSHLKCGPVAETVAYDLVLEVAMKVQNFQQRNLLLHGQWKWLLTEFAAYYGVSDTYTKLRYLSYVMDVATPTADCLTLVYNLLQPVVMKGPTRHSLSHQENRMLGEIEDQVGQLLALVFENYKSLDESSPLGIAEVFRPATRLAAPALEPAVKLYTLLHDIFSPEKQIKLCRYFQEATKRRSRRHLAETDEFVTNNGEGILMDAVTISTAYQKMKSVCLNIRNEILMDIEIHNQHILPSFVDLPNLSSSIYSTDLCSRLQAFLIACPPPGPSPPVAELVMATSDFERDLANWNINPLKGGVDARELFHLHILLWIQEKRLSLLESCKLDKVKWSGVKTQHSTTPFVDDMYDRLRETMADYEIIICRWPEYTINLENAIAAVEKSIIEALDKQYADVLAPLKENMTPKKFGLKYVQKLAKRSAAVYVVPEELGILLNSMKRMLDVLRPKVETQFKSWGSCIPDGGNGNTAPGEHLSEVTVMLRTKFRNYLQAVVEKLAENSKLQNTTKLKKILQDSKETVVESEVQSRMQLLIDQLTSTISRLHSIFVIHVFIAICQRYWDRMGQDILSFLENRKGNRSWYQGARVAVSILDDCFASQMQRMVGNALQGKDLEPPKSIKEVHSILCKDSRDYRDNSFYL